MNAAGLVTAACSRPMRQPSAAAIQKKSKLLIFQHSQVKVKKHRGGNLKASSPESATSASIGFGQTAKPWRRRRNGDRTGSRSSAHHHRHRVQDFGAGHFDLK
jgi:hypothetical protein